MFFLGCAALPEISEEGEYVRLGTTSDQPPCKGTVPYLDRVVMNLQAFLGESMVDPYVDYYWMPDGWARCGKGDEVLGCAKEGEVYTDFIPHEHEIVHAVVKGAATPFFEEGLATALGGSEPRGIFPWMISPKNPLSMMDAKDSHDVDYRTAGAFVWFLIERNGVDTFLMFYQQISRKTKMEEVQKTIHAVYGALLEDLVQEFMDAPSYCFSQLSQCMGSVIPWDDSQWSYRSSTACQGPTAVGPSPHTEIDEDGSWTKGTDDPQSWEEIRIEIVEGGLYHLWVHSTGVSDAPLVNAELFRCGTCTQRFEEPIEFRWSLSSAIDRPVWLEKGLYYAHIENSIEAADPEIGYELYVQPKNF